MACLIPGFEVPARISRAETMGDNFEKETTALPGLAFFP
jgi:hypothetical protein